MTQPDTDEEREPDPPQGRILPTGPGPLVIAGVIGLVLGWSIRPLALRFDCAEPNVSFTAIGALFFVAAIIGATAYGTRRTVRRNRQDLAHHQAVNRLVLGKACALVGSLALGGYLGYALAQLGVANPAVGHAAVARAARRRSARSLRRSPRWLLEHACRVPRRRRVAHLPCESWPSWHRLVPPCVVGNAALASPSRSACSRWQSSPCVVLTSHPVGPLDRHRVRGWRSPSRWARCA